MKIHSLILGAFFLLIIAGNIGAASFDCGKATSEVEKSSAVMMNYRSWMSP